MGEFEDSAGGEGSMTDKREALLENKLVPGGSILSGYEQQRLTFAVAIHHGWCGAEPGVLGTYTANEALKSAQNFLDGLEGEIMPKKQEAPAIRQRFEQCAIEAYGANIGDKTVP